MRYSYALIMGALVFFLIYKILRFDALGYSFNDMYAFLQMSYSWMDGRPFMYDNIWSYHHRIHNYYTVLLWGPLCYTLGAKGLFIAQTALLLLAYGATNRFLIRHSVPALTQAALLLVVLLGPISLWLNDHPNIGWHTELTYLPAALLFGVALGSKGGGNRAKSIVWPVLAGLFLALVKEDGAVLALLIHGSAVAMRYVERADRERSQAPLLVGLLKTSQFWWVIIGWSIVFVIGMAWIAAKNNFAEPRLRNALQLMGTHASEWLFWRQMVSLLAKSLLLLAPIAGLLALLTRPLSRRLRLVVWVCWLTGVLALTVLNIVQSAHYIDQHLFYLVSLTWPPRFVLLWGFSAAFLVLLVPAVGVGLRPDLQPITRKLIGFLWLVQIPILMLARPDLPGWAEWKAAFWGPPGANMDARFMQKKERAAMQRLAADLPHHSNVFAFDYVVPYFHKHYGIWPTGNQWQPADVAILSRPDFQHLRDQLDTLLPGPIDSVQLPNYTIYYRPSFAPFVKPAAAIAKPDSEK